MSPGPQAIASAAMSGPPRGSLRGRTGAVIKREFLHLLPPTIYFAFGFNLIALSMRLVLSPYTFHAADFLLVTMAALVVGKAVLIADMMPFLRRFDTAPLIRPILFKTVVYCLFVFVARLIEANLRYAVGHGGFGGVATFLIDQFSWRHFAFVQLWILVLFLIYVTGSELNTLFGQGEIWRIMTRYSSTDLKLTRRQRIRALSRLSRLTAGHSIAEIADPGSTVHHEMIRLITHLAEISEERSGRQFVINDRRTPK